MIRQLSGGILFTRAQLLAHGVAPNDSFDSGLARALRERFPAMVKDFRHYCHTTHPKAGEMWTWSGAQGPRIANLLTQEAAYEHGSKPGKATTHFVNLAAKELAKFITQEGIQSVALPRLATGVGGLEWNEVEPILAKHLGDLATEVLIYTTYVPGKDAES